MAGLASEHTANARSASGVITGPGCHPGSMQGFIRLPKKYEYPDRVMLTGAGEC
jgi:hypothetical protein